MKKLSLDKTWSECLRMWKWIAGQKAKGISKDADDLKTQWLEENGYKGVEIESNCFFCEYALVSQKGAREMLRVNGALCRKGCPAKKIDPSFDCCEDESKTPYCYLCHPLKFYAKLLELNKIRLSKKKKTKIKKRKK